ncbi:hypothetical protein M758_8G065200 [Ceratodon purpureus]|nr:hypothetical protein M758_8G065200 [Ceratodon purpureus]
MVVFAAVILLLLMTFVACLLLIRRKFSRYSQCFLRAIRLRRFTCKDEIDDSSYSLRIQLQRVCYWRTELNLTELKVMQSIAGLQNDVSLADQESHINFSVGDAFQFVLMAN